MPSSPAYYKNQLVEHHQRIYRVVSITEQNSIPAYELELVADIENSMQKIATIVDASTHIVAPEQELQKFEYAAPLYPMGKRLNYGEVISLIIFSMHKEYRYNIAGSNSLEANIPENEMHWRA